MTKPTLTVKQVTVEFAQTDGKKQLAEFLYERFRGWSPSHQVGAISGSSSLYFNPKEKGDHIVCDAAAVKPHDIHDILDQRPLSFAFAVADGLGYDDYDKKFNISLSEVAATASQDFVERVAKNNTFVTEPQAFLKGIATSSLQAALKQKNKSSYDSQCTLAAGKISYDGKQWQGHFVNIGDGMIVVVSGKTHQVKLVIPAIHFRRFMNNYSPRSLQEALKEDVDPGFTALALEEGDYVIGMTDGVYAGFDLSVQSGPIGTSGPSKGLAAYKKIGVEPVAFSKIFERFTKSTPPSAYEVAEHLLTQAMAKHLQEFSQACILYQDIMQFTSHEPKRYEQMILNDFLVTLKNNNPDLYLIVHAYLTKDSDHDGATFNLDKAFVSDLLNLLAKQEYGDCSTISVMQVPFYADELAKVVIAEPKKAKTMRAALEQYHFAEDIDAIISRLAAEKQIPGKVDKAGFKLGRGKPETVYTEKELKKLKKTVQGLCLDLSSKKLQQSMQSLSLLISEPSTLRAPPAEKAKPLVIQYKEGKEELSVPPVINASATKDKRNSVSLKN